MTRLHRSRLWFVLALVVILVSATALWLRGVLVSDSDSSPLPTPSVAGVSPLPTSIPPGDTTAPPSAWSGAGAVLLWVALGTMLALGIVLLILRRSSYGT